ncbi:MAG: class I SAM-dependent methyltransferase [Gammaproteobacteria bacterium]|nr:class I SAM-dependent methyltransferase [Gammaproteobacteria bacterium]
MRVTTHFLLWSFGLAEAETHTTTPERDCLARHAFRKKRLVEIGVWHGITTCCLRKAMAADGVLFAVDPYPVGRLGFSAQRVISYSQVHKIRNGYVRWLRKTGVEAARDHLASSEEPVDFVFIDGDHSYEGLRGDWQGWSPLVGLGGIVALHDSCSSATRQIDNAGSVIFTREVVLHDQCFEPIETTDTLTVLRRRGHV